MNRTHMTMWALAATCVAATASAQPAFQYDQARTDQAGGFSYVYGNAALVSQPPASFFETLDMSIEANYVQPGGAHDWGNEAVDGATAGAGAVAASGDAFITLDGDGTSEIQVRISSDALLDSSPPTPAGYGGEANARNEYALVTVMNGLTPGQPYAIAYTWSIVAAAGFPAAGGVGALAQGSLDAFVIGFSTNMLFAESLVGVAGQPPLHIAPTGSGLLPFTPTTAANDFIISAKSLAAAVFEGPANFDDLVGATFYAEATFRLVLVPEPAALTPSAAGLWLLARRRRRVT